MRTEDAAGADASGEQRGWSGNVWGILFVVMGAWWMAGELGVVAFDWGIVAPLAIIAVGISMLAGRGCC